MAVLYKVLLYLKSFNSLCQFGVLHGSKEARLRIECILSAMMSADLLTASLYLKARRLFVPTASTTW
jgi:hypothetical protein